MSAPILVDQVMVDTHADTTGDAQWIHNDPVRAASESPFGGPIAQGFLLLSLLTQASSTLTFPAFGPVSMLVNYGFDRVRFLSPVLVGSQVRVRARLAEVRPKDDQRAVLAVDLEMWSESPGRAPTGADGDLTGRDGASRPAPSMAARWLFLAVAAPSH